MKTSDGKKQCPTFDELSEAEKNIIRWLSDTITPTPEQFYADLTSCNYTIPEKDRILLKEFNEKVFKSTELDAARIISHKQNADTSAVD